MKYSSLIMPILAVLVFVLLAGFFLFNCTCMIRGIQRRDAVVTFVNFFFMLITIGIMILEILALTNNGY